MPEEIQSFKQVRSVLDPLSVDNPAKAAAFDAYFDAANAEDFQKRFDKLNIPKDAKAALWDLRFGQEQKQLGEVKDIGTPTAMGRMAVAEAPAIGGAVGGMAGGIPGAIAGGVLGQGVKRALQYRKGETAPAQAGEFAADVGLEGAKQGVFEGAGELAAGAARGLKRIATPLYKSTLSFTDAASLPARTEAAQQGLRLGASVRDTPKGLGRVDQFVSEMTAKVDAKIAEAKAAGAKVDVQILMAPVDDQVKEFAKSLAPTEPEKAAIAIRQDILKRLGAKKEVINIDTSGDYTPQLPAPHVQKKAPPNFKQVEVDVPPPRFQDPEKIQEAKRATSRTLRKAYGEEKTPGIETLKAGERGAKQAMEEAVPGIKDPNWQEHVALTLRDAMERTLKQKPGWAKGLMPYLIGGAAAGALTGHMTPAMIVSLAAHEAVRNPAVMSRLAIWLERAGTKLPKIAEPTVKYGLRFGTPLLGEMPPSRFEQPQQNEVK
jgi:hypothetical protein